MLFADHRAQSFFLRFCFCRCRRACCARRRCRHRWHVSICHGGLWKNAFGFHDGQEIICVFVFCLLACPWAQRVWLNVLLLPQQRQSPSDIAMECSSLRLICPSSNTQLSTVASQRCRPESKHILLLGRGYRHRRWQHFLPHRRLRRQRRRRCHRCRVMFHPRYLGTVFGFDFATPVYLLMHKRRHLT